MNKFIVLDKSYLVRASPEDISKLCSENRALMPYYLFMELMRHNTPEKRKQRAECFKKLPKADNPLELIEGVHNLIAFEIDNKKACGPIWEHIRKKSWHFNQGLVDPNWLPENHDDNIKEWNRELNKGLENLRGMGSTLHEIFPELEKYKPGSSASIISELKFSVVNDRDYIRNFVFRSYHGELKLDIDENWALFRKAQVELIYMLDYVKKYGAKNLSVISKALEHDFFDMEYCILGVLAGALAACDKTLSGYFNMLCPEGILIDKYLKIEA